MNALARSAGAARRQPLRLRIGSHQSSGPSSFVPPPASSFHLPSPFILHPSPFPLPPWGPRLLLVSLSFCLLVCSGCRSQRERYVVDAFSAEARMMEDKIYELQDRVTTLERRLARPGAADAADSRPRGSGSRPGPARSSNGDAPRSPAPVPGFDFDEIPDLTPPEVDPGSPVNPGDFRNSSQRSGAPPETRNQAMAAKNTPPATQVAARPARRVASGDSAAQVTGVSFDAYLLGNAPADGSQVEGLELVIVPLNERNELVPVAGEVTVVVLDSRDGSHLGRWEYDAATARVALQAEGEDPGILLELRWQQVLRDPRLHVFVRFTLPDGRRLESDRPFVASGPGEGKSRSDRRWRSARRERSGASGADRAGVGGCVRVAGGEDCRPEPNEYEPADRGNYFSPDREPAGSGSAGGHLSLMPARKFPPIFLMAPSPRLRCPS
jgi:hypothetical protein